MQQAFEDALALIRLATDPEAVKARIEAIQAADATSAADRQAAFEAREEASQFRAKGEALRKDAVVVEQLATQKLEAMQRLKDAADLTKADAEAQSLANERKAAALASKEMELLVRERTLAEREEAADKRDAEVATLRADLDRRLAAVKSAAA